VALHHIDKPIATSCKEDGATYIAQEETAPRAALNGEGGQQGHACDPNQQIPIGKWEGYNQEDAAQDARRVPVSEFFQWIGLQIHSQQLRPKINLRLAQSLTLNSELSTANCPSSV